MTLSETMRDYLKAIHGLRATEERVTVSVVADQLGVAVASASNMVKRLEESDLVHRTPSRGIGLTEKGEWEALRLIRAHRLIELFLTEVVGLPWDEVHDEAERMEHAVSDRLLERIAELLGHPAVDPHGDPIPTEEGRLDEEATATLTDLEVGQRAEVRRITAQDPEVLQYLSSVGLTPEQTVTLLDKGPFEGPLTLLIDGAERIIGWKVARMVQVVAL
ncbi:MAG: metal-dependent transcriptional regulator [Nitrospinota bacterium]